MALTHEAGSWIAELKDYLQKGILPPNDTDAERIARQDKAYIIHDKELYRRCPNGVALRCISAEEASLLLRKIHAGECGHHASSRTLVGKAYCQGFFWPTAHRDTTDLVTTCEVCQFHAKQIHQPSQELHTIPLSWPLRSWG